MLKLLKTFHGNVVGISAEGTVSAKDYENVLIPEVKKVLEMNTKVRLFYHLGSSFKGFDVGAMADDVFMSLKRYTNWEKVAMVSDNAIITSVVKFFGYLIPGEVKIFKDKELDEAKAWILA